jgi:IclR family transcriptional regulator, acetate operon repressor
MAEMLQTKPAYPIESVDNALTLLRMFGEGQPVRVADASTRIGVARSTAHRLLAMLQYHGFVTQDPATRAYVAGPALLATGLAAVRKLDIRQQARPHLERLADETGETVHLVIRQGRDVLFLDAVEGSQAVRVASRVGAIMPAHCTSVGKALLAELSDEELASLLPEGPLPGLTPKSIVSHARLDEEIAGVRKRGYAISKSEAEAGVGSIGVSIPSTSVKPTAALSISAPLDRLTRGVVSKFAKAAQQTARMIATEAA